MKTNFAAVLLVAGVTATEGYYKKSSNYAPSYGELGNRKPHSHAAKDPDYNPDTWFSYYSEFRPNIIEYSPASPEFVIYAQCELYFGSGAWKIQFGQYPGKPTQVKHTKDGFIGDENVEVGFRFGSYARTNPDAAGAVCGNAGVGYNPL